MFFLKKCRLFQLNVPFSNFEPLFQKRYENTYCFCNIFPKFLPLCTCSQTLVIFWKKSCCSLKMSTNYYLFSQLWASVVTKLMKRAIIYMKYFLTSNHHVYAHKICSSLKMLTIYYLFPQIWATFARKFLKRPTQWHLISHYNIFLKEIPSVSIC